MDYEKAYKDALKRARKANKTIKNLINIKQSDIQDKFEYIFPELAESEDDRVRKELLEHCVNRRDGKQVCVDASDYRRWAAWLERQGEQKLAWSDEDEITLTRIVFSFEEEMFPSKQECKKNIDFLNSLKNRVQSHWKPTEEQMSCFKQAIDLFKMKVNDTIVQNYLDSLYEQLEKL